MHLVQSGWFVQHSFHSAYRLATNPPPSVPFPDVCLSLCLSPCREKQPLHLSINVLSFHFLFLSVYLSVWHVGSCLGAPGLLSAKCWFLFFCQFTCLSQTLRLDVSTYLLVFLFSGKSFIKSQQAGNVPFSLQSKLIMAPWYVLFLCLYIEQVQMHAKHVYHQ